jgi:hypothetical protein
MRSSTIFEGFRTIGNDIDDVTDLVLVEVGRERDLYAFVSIAHLRASGKLTIPFFLKSLENA